MNETFTSRKNVIYLDNLVKAHTETKIIGEAPEMLKVFDDINIVSRSDVCVSIQGETGTGKELVARMIHELSNRSKGVFVPLNCSAVPESLFETELFGHIRGAYTGAIKVREGKFGTANDGTLFLDEVHSVPTSQQSKLLRAIEYGEYCRIGSDTEEHSNARIIVASSEDLYDKVKSGEMLASFYYRIEGFPIRLPSLAERRSDIHLLVDYFCNAYSHGQKVVIEDDAQKLIYHYSWPGNVRQLQGVIQKAIAVHSMDYGEIKISHDDITRVFPMIKEYDEDDALEKIWSNLLYNGTLRDAQIIKIRAALKHSPTREEAAKHLGYSSRGLRNKLHAYGLM